MTQLTNWYVHKSSDQEDVTGLNPCHAEIIFGNIRICSHFFPFFNTEMAGVVEIGRQGPATCVWSKQWLMMIWWCKEPGPNLNIKTVFPRYGDSHVKDKTVGETVLSLTWGSIYWWDGIFILRRPPRQQQPWYWCSRHRVFHDQC